MNNSKKTNNITKSKKPSFLCSYEFFLTLVFLFNLSASYAITKTTYPINITQTIVEMFIKFVSFCGIEYIISLVCMYLIVLISGDSI